jgi:hypothetical protein
MIPYVLRRPRWPRQVRKAGIIAVNISLNVANGSMALIVLATLADTRIEIHIQRTNTHYHCIAWAGLFYMGSSASEGPKLKCLNEHLATPQAAARLKLLFNKLTSDMYESSFLQVFIER